MIIVFSHFSCDLSNLKDSLKSLVRLSLYLCLFFISLNIILIKKIDRDREGERERERERERDRERERERES